MRTHVYIRPLVIFFGLCFYGIPALGQQVLWSEDFEDEGTGATTGTAGGSIGGGWSVTTTPSGGGNSFSRQTYETTVLCFPLYLNLFQVNQTGTEAVWASDPIDISTLGDVALELNLASGGSSASDYLRAYYKLDGGSEILFAELNGGTISLENLESVIFSGNSVEIIIRALENTTGNAVTCFGFDSQVNAIGFDDIRLIDITTLYSIADGDWTNGNTWSYTGYNGATCSPCTPSEDTKVFIGNNRTVTLDDDGEVIDVTIENTGALEWDGGHTLDIRRGGQIAVDAGASLSYQGFNNAEIVYGITATNRISVDGSFAIDDISIIGGAPQLLFEGSGDITINGNLIADSDNAMITNNKTGNALNILGNIYFESSGITFTNNTDVTADDISFESTDCSVVNNGTIDLSGNIIAVAGTDDDNVVTNNTGATFDFVTFAANSADLSLNNAGTVNQTGTFTGIPANTNAANAVSNLDGGEWNYSGTGHDTDLRLFADEGTNTFTYNATGNQTIITPASGSAYVNLSLSGSGTKTTSVVTTAPISNTLMIDGDLILSGSAILNVSTNTDNISLGGDWIVQNTASFTEGSQTVTLRGTSDQTISNTSGETFYNLILNKPSGQLLLATSPSTDVNISGTMTFTSGIMTTSTSESLTFNDEALVSGGGTNASHVDGPVRKIGEDSFIFPTGDGGYGARIQVAPSGANNTTVLTARYVTGGATPSASNLSGVTRVSQIEYWELTRSGTLANNTNRVTLYWESGTRSEINDVSSTTNLFVARYNGTNWVSAGPGSITGGSTASSGSIQSADITAANIPNNTLRYYTFGSNASSTTINPLPVELISFDARLNMDEVLLTWTTANEIDNDFFTIEKTTDAETFYEVGKVAGKGTSQLVTEYFFTDEKPTPGRSYYRLRQTDYDGKSTFSELKSVVYDGAKRLRLNVFPNPTNGKTATIEISGFTDLSGAADPVPVQIYDQRGIKLYEFSLFEVEPGVMRRTLSPEETLPPGLYFVKAGQTFRLSLKLVVD